MTACRPAIDTTCDGHVHTKFCHHATGEMEDYVRAAIARGLRELCFLEHLEVGVRYREATWLTEDDFDEYFREGERLQRIYRDRLTIGLGVEAGFSQEHLDELRLRLAKRPWSRIGLSFHYALLPGQSEHLNLLSRKEENIRKARELGAAAILSHYLASLRDAVRQLPADVLCHLDAALRYLPDLEYSKSHLEQIDALLDLVKAKGLSLEINTSGVPIRGEPFPAAGIVAKAVQREIPLVAGSDAHRPEDVGRHFDVIGEFLKAAVSA